MKSGLFKIYVAENALFFLKGFPLVQTTSMDRASEFNGRDVILVQIVCLVSVIPIYLIIYIGLKNYASCQSFVCFPLQKVPC